MFKRPLIAFVLVVFAFAGFAQTEPAASDPQIAFGVMRGGVRTTLWKGTAAAAEFPDAVINAPMGALPVGGGIIEECWWVCFVDTFGDCGQPGTMNLEQNVSPPFRAFGFRLSQDYEGCTGAPTAFPATIAPNHYLAFDLAFAPTQPGSFASDLIFRATNTVQNTNRVIFKLTGDGLSSARVVVTDPPNGMLQAANTGGGTDSYTLRNIGNAPTDITLSKHATFFEHSPTQFRLAPGEARTVTITGNPIAAGDYDGFSMISGAGVPAGSAVRVRLISAARPTGPVTPRVQSRRVESRATLGSAPPPITIPVTNNGSSTLRGLVSTDVPWITVPPGLFTVNPGATQNLIVGIDRAKRVGNSVGAVNGTITVKYLVAQSGKGISGNDVSGTGSVSVGVVDFAAPVVDTTPVPQIPPGEIALFIPGVQRRANSVSDISFANATSGTISDLKMYYVPAGGSATSSLTSTVNELLPSFPVSMTNIVQNLFNGTNQAGSLQIRSSRIHEISVQSLLLDFSSGNGAVGTAMPVVRSDQGIPGAGVSYIPGVSGEGSRQTDLFIQEVAGAPGQAQLEFLASSGAVLGDPSYVNVGPFGVAERLDAVPDGAVTVRVTNTGASGRVAAVAVVRDSSTGDAWSLVAGVSTGSSFIPLVSAGREKSEVAIVNPLAGPTNVTLQFNAPGGRTRLIARGSSSKDAGPDALSTTITLAPQETRLITDLSSLLTIPSGTKGYVTVVPEASISVSSRLRTDAGTGTSVPAAAVGAGVNLNQIASIAGLEDASPETLLSGAGGSTTSLLGILETKGQPAKVRVTLHFAFNADLVQANGEVTRDFSLRGRQLLLLEDMTREMFGDQRSSYGDLHNVQVDVTVIEGAGEVVPFTRSIDVGTGDAVMRR